MAAIGMHPRRVSSRPVLMRRPYRRSWAKYMPSNRWLAHIVLRPCYRDRLQHESLLKSETVSVPLNEHCVRLYVGSAAYTSQCYSTGHGTIQIAISVLR